MPGGDLRSAETAVVARRLGWCLDWGTRPGMGHPPAFQEQVKMSDYQGNTGKPQIGSTVGF